jgi:hypothetical protein
LQEEKAKLSDFKVSKGQILPKFDATNFAVVLFFKKKNENIDYIIKDGFCKVRKPVEKRLLFHASKLVPR